VSLNINKVFLGGRLVRDPDARFAPNGKRVVSFTVATNRYSKRPDGGRDDQAEFTNVTAWEPLADYASGFVKGQAVYVEGRLQTRTWEKDGEKRRATEVVAAFIQSIDSPKPASLAEQQVVVGTRREVNPDEIPF
jgi:single-strand DNA-binding protein